MTKCFLPILSRIDSLAKPSQACTQESLQDAFLERINTLLCFPPSNNNNNNNNVNRESCDLDQLMHSYLRQNFQWFDMECDGECTGNSGDKSKILNWRTMGNLLSQLHDLRLGRRFRNAIVATVGQGILIRLEERCKSQYDEPNQLRDMVHWIHQVAFAWMDAWLSSSVTDFDKSQPHEHAGEKSSLQQSTNIEQLRRSILKQFYGEFCTMRIAEFFDMVVDFPNSEPALVDLRDALKQTKLHFTLVREFTKA